MVPQVLATIHLLFADQSRGRAFGIYGVVLPCRGYGFLLGALFFAIEASGSALTGLFAALALFALSIAASAAFLTWMRRAVTPVG
jgi:hypothetical protein